MTTSTSRSGHLRPFSALTSRDVMVPNRNDRKENTMRVFQRGVQWVCPGKQADPKEVGKRFNAVGSNLGIPLTRRAKEMEHAA